MAKRRRTVRPRKRARSAAQRAATARMLAANRSRRGGGTKRRKTSARRRSTGRTTVVVASAPARRRSPARKRASAPAKRRRSRRSSGMRLGGSGGLMNQSIALLKDGAIMGAGALGVDMVMGQVNKVLPTDWDTPLNTDGTPNYKNAAVKAAVSVGIGYFGAKYLPASMRGLALKAATGALSIQAYNIIKGSIPSDFLPLGGQQRIGLRGAPLNTLMIPAGAGGNTGSLAGAPRAGLTYYRR